MSNTAVDQEKGQSSIDSPAASVVLKENDEKSHNNNKVNGVVNMNGVVNVNGVSNKSLNSVKSKSIQCDEDVDLGPPTKSPTISNNSSKESVNNNFDQVSSASNHNPTNTNSLKINGHIDSKVEKSDNTSTTILDPLSSPVSNGIPNGIPKELNGELLMTQDDPIPSGTGNVSKDCSPSDLEGWGPLLSVREWHTQKSRPKGLANLVKMGIPEALRAEAWQRLSGCSSDNASLMEKYRILLTQTAPTEDIIRRDVERTYPAHPKFRSDSVDSQVNSLFKVCKAWAVYDPEVGYCQGLSFLVATLLLHMPEEQAFCVFVRIMESYGLRDLFRSNFGELHLRLHQLDCLIEEQLPALHRHFRALKVEPMMYASQWFLTVFTAKFPLNAVFHIVDLFLLDGIDTLFLVSLALLQLSQQDLLILDYEGIFKYFSVQMPKRYIDHVNVQRLIITATTQLSLKRLKHHAKSYKPNIVSTSNSVGNNQINNLGQTIDGLERDNKNLTESYLRLLQENNNLVHDLARTKIQLQTQIDDLEDTVEQMKQSFESSRQQVQICNNIISDLEDEKSRLEVEVMQLKEVCRRELHPRRRWRNADAVCFDVDSTVCRDEAIDELAKFVGKFEAVAELTRSAMRGNFDFRKALHDRLDIIRPTQEILKEYIRTHPPKLTDGVEELIKLLQQRRVDVYLISGGFDVIIEQVAKKLSIPMDHVFSNSIKFYFDGSYAGFDESRPTSRQDGKSCVISGLKKAHGYKNLVIIGDGVTDLEACPPADAFIGFGGNQAREPVKKRAEWFVYSFRDLINELMDADADAAAQSNSKSQTSVGAKQLHLVNSIPPMVTTTNGGKSINNNNCPATSASC